MAKDTELDRLKVAQDLAFSRKQTAYDTQDAAWKRRKAAGDVMHALFDEKDLAYNAQQGAWDSLQRLRDNYGPRIEQLNKLQEAAFQNMSSSFSNATSAYDRRDGAAAKSYAEQGHVYKAESKSYVEERRRLIAELRSADDHQKSYAPAFQAAKARFDSAKRDYDAAKAAHERVQTEFKAIKEAFDKASKAFKTRLDVLKAQNTKRLSDKRSIAQKAGIPNQYQNDVWVSKADADGNVNIYFGGAGRPDGAGHGHYTLDRNGAVTYKRDPFDPHGAHNFTEDDSLGSMLYDRRARANVDPLGGDGIFARRDGGREHTTQYYDDGYRLSSDTDGQTNVKRHWTNQDVRKKAADRHAPPEDAK